MGEKKAALAARAWGILRLALLWARKGGAFKRNLVSGSNFRKGLRRGSGGIHEGYQIRHGDKELPFGEAPVFGVRSTRRAGKKQGSMTMRIIVSSLLCVKTPRPADLGFNGDNEHGSRREAVSSGSNGEIDENKGGKELASSEWPVGSPEAEEEEEEEFASAQWLVGPLEGDEEDEFTWAECEEGLLEAIEEEKGVDARAEEFIARFYQQMKLQRQVSLLQYNEMLHGST